MAGTTGMRISGYQRPVDLIEIANRAQTVSAEERGRSSFKEMFSQELARSRNIAFSRHAHERLHSRGLALSDEKLNSIAGAIDKADAKGSRETLVLSDDEAFVVSVPNRTVITVFDRDNLREGVVTAIDSAVII
ncbi:MAG: flagellar protein [candidate division Zixibacteria bacterium]|nr:flagellar protein [candidate division Zixibacteria bacterium]MDH3935786.1 flagellar protein [candidate division Zixibacteria bacterium]MDH4032280.1 flagellar protein [candidate division Zixibacteria bacterium]